ncbi:MAG: EAL domain-containing protein [Candidatus Omnitrophica bacterium]|nr:EAL domain-containing protein [Candidatus Omnitrophota bacterium]
MDYKGLLKEQIEKRFGLKDNIPEKLMPFIEEVDSLYGQMAKEHTGKDAKIQELNKEIQELKLKEERYMLSSLGSDEGLWDWNFDTNEIYYSKNWKKIIGYDDDEIVGKPEEWFSKIHLNDVDRVKKVLTADNKIPNTQITTTYQILHSDGDYRWVTTKGTFLDDKNGRINRIVGSQKDITLQKVAEHQLLHDALHDNLTGLANRALFFDRLAFFIERAKRIKDYKYAVVFMDLDRFKVINDSLGHLFGDQLLIQIAEILKKNMRGNDTIARLGGDEFTILLDAVEDIGDAIRFAKRIQREITTSFNIKGHDIFVTASIGIAISTPEIKRPEEILRNADISMYQAKAKGRSRHEIYRPEMHTTALNLFYLEKDLRNAIDNNEFELYFQPIISSESGKIIRLEALIRWNHPERGLVNPMSFIPLAEETGLIIDIGEWVLRQSCIESKKWQDSLNIDIGVSVNFSARQFQFQNIAKLIQKVSKDTNVNLHNLEIEITETTAMKNIDYSVKVLNELRLLGLKISIDDFGIGYSSLSCINILPIDSIKIDRTFTRNIGGETKNVIIVENLISMAHNLKLKVVAEGVETPEQLQFLMEKKCDELQGYLFSKPLSCEKMYDFINKHINGYDLKSYHK